jgi:hypothetical protein
MEYIIWSIPLAHQWKDFFSYASNPKENLKPIKYVSSRQTSLSFLKEWPYGRLGGFKSKASSKGYEIRLVLMGITLKTHWNIMRDHWELGNTLRIPRCRKFSEPPFLYPKGSA